MPDASLRPGLGFSDRFLRLGLHTFREVARYVHRLPYGPNRLPAGDDALFRDGCGTCTSKHGAIAVLARELGLPVYRWYGIYKLNEDIVFGAGAILEHYRIPFVPAGHCFLFCSDEIVDLTAGNNHGKKKDVDSFLTIWPDPPGESQNRRRTEVFIKLLLHSDPAFSHLSFEELNEVRSRCLTCMQKNRRPRRLE